MRIVAITLFCKSGCVPCDVMYECIYTGFNELQSFQKVLLDDVAEKENMKAEFQEAGVKITRFPFAKARTDQGETVYMTFNDLQSFVHGSS